MPTRDPWSSPGATGRRPRTLAVTPAIADAAAALPETFPGDPAERLIYSTAIELGLPLVTKDRRMHQHTHPARPTVW